MAMMSGPGGMGPGYGHRACSASFDDLWSHVSFMASQYEVIQREVETLRTENQSIRSEHQQAKDTLALVEARIQSLEGQLASQGNATTTGKQSTAVVDPRIAAKKAKLSVSLHLV
jgi:chromosome segregation ATPase